MIHKLRALHGRMRESESRFSSMLEQVHETQKASAVNLLHYLVMRSQDIRELQCLLHENGFSTLANAEAYALHQVQSILKYFETPDLPAPVTPEAGNELHRNRVHALFGRVPRPGLISVMVTFKSSFADDPIIVKKLLKAGMNIARINCAHDDREIWMRMIRTLRLARESTGRECKIYMDLAGPKIRTRIRGRRGRLLVEEDDLFLLADNERLRDELPVVGCTIPGVAAQLKTGERVLFDDGIIEARVNSIRPGAAEMQITRVSVKNSFLKTGRGINFPDSHLSLSALTDYDRSCIPFILEYADLIGYSFVHNIPDLTALRNEMNEKKLPMILKIETPEAFRNLPGLLFHAMKDEAFGLMIARGDLAVEMGFEQMDEVQGEILAMCRAAHMPVVLATQVLETLNKKGIATRAEIVDASEAIRADCILLNKGRHTAQVIRSLHTILERKSRHYCNNLPVYITMPTAAEFTAAANH